MKFDDFLKKLEIDNKILDFRFEQNQVPMYLIVRFNFLISIVKENFNLTNSYMPTSKKSLKKTIRYVYNTLRYNLFFAPKKEIYIFSNVMFNEFENGKYTNKLHNEFYQEFKDKTQIIESSYDFEYLMPKKEKVFLKILSIL